MKNLNKILTFVMCGCFALAIIMIFLPAIGEGDDTYNGLKVVFGYTAKRETVLGTATAEIFKFSFMNLLTYILVIAALVLTVLQIVKGENKIFTYATIGCALVAAIFFFLTKNLTVIPEDAKKILEAANTTFAKEATLGVGAILGGVFSIIGCLCGAAKVVLPMVNQK